jgi:hypothetical protein
MRSIIANLTPTIEASGPHDFAVRVSTFVRAKCLRCVLPRPSHPNLTSVTIAKRPSCVGRDGERCRSDLGEKNTRIFLHEGLDRPIGDLPVGRGPSSFRDAPSWRRPGIHTPCRGYDSGLAPRAPRNDAVTCTEAPAYHLPSPRPHCYVPVSIKSAPGGLMIRRILGRETRCFRM